jgi:hypothetical protein
MAFLVSISMPPNCLAQYRTVGDGGQVDHTAFAFNPCGWEKDTGNYDYDYFYFHVCDSLNGQRYDYVEYIDNEPPSPPDFIPSCTLTEFDRIPVNSYHLGALLIYSHGSPSGFLIEAYHKDSLGLARLARDSAYANYLREGFNDFDISRVEGANLYGIAIEHPYIYTRGNYPGALVYVSSCYGDINAEVFTQLGSYSAEVALGTPCFPKPGDATAVVIYSSVNRFFKNMNGWASRVNRSADSARKWLGDTLRLYGNGDVTLAPAVKAHYIPTCPQEGDSVVFYLDTECDWGVDPVVTFNNCDTCEMSDVYWRGNDVMAICGVPPSAGSAFGVTLHWESVKSSRNESFLDGNCVPAGYQDGGLGPAHDDYSVPRICLPPPPKVKMGQIWNASPYGPAELALTVEGSTLEFGYGQLNVVYDNTVMELLNIESGQFLKDCNWGELNWQQSYGNVDITIANNGGGCWGAGDTSQILEIAILTFGPLFSIAKMEHCDSTAAGQEFIGCPIRFSWFSNGDYYNSFQCPNGDTAYFDKLIVDYDSNVLWDEDDDINYPEWLRDDNKLGTADAVLNNPWPGFTYIRKMEYYNGIVRWNINPDNTGDINLNGVANEIADAVMFSSYFIYGPDVLHDDTPPDYFNDRVAASEVNGDGVPLTVADLVYMIRIITGDAVPFEGAKPAFSSAEMIWYIHNGSIVVDWNSESDAGAVLLVLEHQGGQFGAPELTEMAEKVEVKAHNSGTELRILISGMEKGARVRSGNGCLVKIPIISTNTPIRTLRVEAADYYGGELNVRATKTTSIPENFVLYQNAPNPFNVNTGIRFDLRVRGHVTIAVYDILGRPVAELKDEFTEAGIHEVVWDGRDSHGRSVGTGIYFYRLITEFNQESRKMVLLK